MRRKNDAAPIIIGRYSSIELRDKEMHVIIEKFNNNESLYKITYSLCKNNKPTDYMNYN